jgi:hypothetical protein
VRVGVSVVVLGLLWGEIALTRTTTNSDPPNVRRSIFTLDPNGPEISSLRHGIQVMQSRPGTDPTSWTFQTNIHGTYDQPSNQQQAQAWNLCQHGSFFFFSWHRMYLYYFERILRAASGDPNLTLPYWNYTDDTNVGDPDRRQLPLPFRQPAVECVTPTTPGCNPLFVSERAGPINDGTGYLPPSSVDTSAAFMYTNFDAPAGSGFASFGGGVVPQPVHFNMDWGALETTPHNVVHTDIGGFVGWMTDPNRSARDPIFFLHHANIDRLWKRWLALGGGRQDPLSDQVWMTTSFTFYDENGNQKQLSGKDILDTVSQLNYCYDDDPECTPGAGPPAPTNCFVVRLNCQHEATMACDPTPNTLSLAARIANLNPPAPWSPVGYTPGTPQNPASVVYDGVILPGPDGPRNNIQYDFEACAVNSSGQRNCVWPVPTDTVVPPAGCPGSPPPGPGPTPKQCIQEGCVPRHGGGCICE